MQTEQLKRRAQNDRRGKDEKGRIDDPLQRPDNANRNGPSHAAPPGAGVGAGLGAVGALVDVTITRATMATLFAS